MQKKKKKANKVLNGTESSHQQVQDPANEGQEGLST